MGKAWSLNLAIASGKGFEEKACLSAITSCCFPKKGLPFFRHKSEPSKQYMGFRIIWRKFVTIPNLATNQHPALMAASRLLGAAAACLILLSFAAGHRKSYWSGSIKAAIVICQQIFAILALVIFLVKIPCKKKVLQNRLFLLWRRDPVLELQFPTPLRVLVPLGFATQPVQIAS